MNVRPRPADTRPCYLKPEPFDVLQHKSRGPEARNAVALATIICSSCPIREACYQNAEATGENWVKAFNAKPRKARVAA